MSNNNQGSDPSILLLMVILLFCGLMWVIWHASRVFWLDHVFRWLRFGEVWTINLFAHHYDACLDWLRYAKVVDPTPSQDMVNLTNTCFGTGYIQSQPVGDRPAFYNMSLPPILALGAMTTLYYRWPMSIVLACIGIYTMFYSPHTKFGTRHTLETFIKTQAKMWPVISPITKINPSDTGRILGEQIPDKLPMFAEPLSPEEWVSWNRIPIVNGIPDRDATLRSFTQQLGPRWNGLESTPPHIRGLLAAFAIKGGQKREESDELLGRLALAWNPEKGFKMDTELSAFVTKVMRDPEIGGKILQICDQHAWRTTAVLGALRWARAQGGVLAPAQFVWVRAEDRPLWYPLNNLGRRSFHSEGAGAMAHFMAEQAAQKPLPIPRVETAIGTLVKYLSNTERNPTPIPPRENSKG